MAALRAAIFPLFAKNRRGGHFLPPPPPVRVLTLAGTAGGAATPQRVFINIFFVYRSNVTKFSTAYRMTSFR